MPQYFDKVSIGKMYGIPEKEVLKIIRNYKDVIKPSMQGTDMKYYALENAELINEIYYKTIIGKLERQIREELKLPRKKEKIVTEENISLSKLQGMPKTEVIKSATNPKEKGVNKILFDLFKAKLEEYYENGLITKSQLNELLEYERIKSK